MSVKQLLAVVKQVTGVAVDPVVTERRAGDPAQVVAAADAIARDLGWSASHGVEDLVSSAWKAWRVAHPVSRVP